MKEEKIYTYAAIVIGVAIAVALAIIFFKTRVGRAILSEEEFEKNITFLKDKVCFVCSSSDDVMNVLSELGNPRLVVSRKGSWRGIPVTIKYYAIGKYSAVVYEFTIKEGKTLYVGCAGEEISSVERSAELLYYRTLQKYAKDKEE